MKIIAINGSPRKNWNTSKLLQQALSGAAAQGAETELIHLYDLQFRGCVSCFACKRKGKANGQCVMKDDLSPVLESISECDALLLGSPIYYGNITSGMAAFIERLLFSNMTYNSGERSTFRGKVATGFIYTMNVPKAVMDAAGYNAMFSHYQNILTRLGGPSSYMTSNDTSQFDDYANYEASMFDPVHKAEVQKNQFPLDLEHAAALGKKLISR
jgi:multimeric flavodoxin WrbA